MVSANRTDKSEAFSYSIGENGAPIINDAKVSIECEVDGNYELENFDNFICRIQATYADDSVLNADGKIDYSKCIIDFEEEASMEPADTILGAPVYLPFDLSKQEDRDALRDHWIRCRQTGSEYRISAFKHRDDYGWKAHTPQVGLRDGGQLLNNYEFLDGSPIGHREGGRKHD